MLHIFKKKLVKQFNFVKFIKIQIQIRLQMERVIYK